MTPQEAIAKLKPSRITLSVGRYDLIIHEEGVMWGSRSFTDEAPLPEYLQYFFTGPDAIKLAVDAYINKRG